MPDRTKRHALVQEGRYGVMKRALSRLDDFSVGDTVRLRVARGNKEREVVVRLQAGTQ